MQLKQRILLMELKKNIKNLPLVILGSLILLALIGVFAYTASQSVLASEHIVQAKVGVITSDADDPNVLFAMNYINQLESSSIALEFEIMESEKAMLALENEDLLAVLIFPDNIVEGILYGNNIPIQVLFCNDSSLSSVFLTELTKAGASLLSSAQAGTYTTAELYTSFGANDSLNDAFNDIDLMNLSFALYREDLFVTEASTLGGTSSTIIFYISTAILLLLFFIGAAFVPSQRREKNDFYSVLFSQNISTLQYLFLKWLAHVIILFGLLLLFGIVLLQLQNMEQVEDLLWISRSPINLLFLFTIAVFLASYHMMVYQIAPDSSMAILFFFVLGSLLVFLGGGIIPSVFFPTALARIASLLPSAQLQNGIIMALSGRFSYPWLPLFGYSLFFFIIGYLIFILRREQNTL